MINIVFYNTEDGQLTGYKVQGHAQYATQGKDIICAAVSSATEMVANTITEIYNIDAEVVVKDASLSVRVFQKDAKMCRDILLGLKLHLCLLEEQYPKYINVNYTEV